MPRMPMTAIRPTSRRTDRRLIDPVFDAVFRRQRPWHFLYLRPDPHQHASFRPIRAPLGVKPGFGPPDVAPLPPITGSSPSDSRIGRDAGADGPPRRIADPAAATAGVDAAAPAATSSPPSGAPDRAPFDPFPLASDAAPRASEAATAGSPPGGTAG